MTGVTRDIAKAKEAAKRVNPYDRLRTETEKTIRELQARVSVLEADKKSLTDQMLRAKDDAERHKTSMRHNIERAEIYQTLSHDYRDLAKHLYRQLEDAAAANRSFWRRAFDPEPIILGSVATQLNALERSYTTGKLSGGQYTGTAANANTTQQQAASIGNFSNVNNPSSATAQKDLTRP